MKIVHCPNCDTKMSRVVTEGDMSTYICPKCNKTVIRSVTKRKRIKRSEQMKDLGIEKYRDVQGGDLEEEDDF